MVSTQSTLQDALEALLAESTASTCVTGRRGEYAGLITIDTLVGHLSSMREEHAHDHDAEPSELDYASLFIDEAMGHIDSAIADCATQDAQ